MNTIPCPKCGFQNQAGLAFCTNCGNQLSAPPPPASYQPAAAPPTAQPFGQPQSFTPAPPVAAKSNTGRNLALFGGIGCLALLLLGVGGIGGLYYLGSRKQTGNVNVAVNTGGYNGSFSNSRAFNSSSNSSSANTNTSNANSAGSDVDATLSRMMPPQIGQYKLQSSGAGNAEKDFPGAEKIGKATYAKGSKKVDLVIASFASAADAKTRYSAFLQGFKSRGARILNQQKVKGAGGAETGEAAIYSYSGVYEGMFYNETYGARITTTDLNTLSEFATEFGNYFK